MTQTGAPWFQGNVLDRDGNTALTLKYKTQFGLGSMLGFLVKQSHLRWEWSI